MAARIDDYGLIGDMKGSALVSKSGDVDWVCVPRFDSEACIAALLGRDEHGRWGLRPTTRIRKCEQRYRENTLILETEIDCDGGRIRILDLCRSARSAATLFASSRAWPVKSCSRWSSMRGLATGDVCPG
jgi:GH15 family glucan-1,4-alpha-glucosidase